ncbi:MAG: type VI secretion system-associated FHA domain protein TagH [Sulfitobacter sp.]
MTLRLRIDNFDTLEDGGPTWITLDQRGASIGRRASMDWILPDPAKHVSSHHFDIQFADGTYWLRDVSTNGTYLQGQYHRIEGALALQGGERLIVGHYVIAVELGNQAPAAVPVGQTSATTDPWGGVEDDSDPWDLSAEHVHPVNPLPSPAANPHHLDEMAQDFVPLQQPTYPQVSPPPIAPVHQPNVPRAQSHPVQSAPPPTQGRPVPPEHMQTPPPPVAEHQPTQGPSHQDVLEAFCRGAGLPLAALQGADAPMLAEAWGKSAKVSVAQIMEMLQDRANVKQFTRGGERTMRSATGNNPLKFMPDPEQAFDALFVQPREGFMSGADGFENALSDLRRHQTAVFAALQPALAEVLAGLSPDEIEDREGTSSNLLSGSKKSRNWDAFVRAWDEKVSTGDHGMLDVFMRAFAKAYAEVASKAG